MKKNLFPLLVLLALLLSACAGPKLQPTFAPVPTPAPSAQPLPVPPTKTPDATPPPEGPIWGKQSYSHNFTDESGAEIMTVSYLCPLIENSGGFAAWEKINAYYAATQEELLSAADDTAAWAGDDFAASTASGFPFQPYLEELTYNIVRQTDRYVSISRELYTNTGGPHPMVFRLAERFDLTTGAQLTFLDFFTNPDVAIDRIQAEILAQNAAQVEVGPEDTALAAAFQPEHFYLTDSGFVFWFQAGDLAALNSPLEFTIPYNTLEDLMVEWINQ